MKKMYILVKDDDFESPSIITAVEKHDGLYHVNGEKIMGTLPNGEKVHVKVGRISDSSVIYTHADFREIKKEKAEKIVGLKELENAISEKMNASYLQEERIAKADYRPVEFPEPNIDELRNKYPMASAYLTAKNFNESSNSGKRIAGKKAMKAIEDGGDYELAIAEMKAEWKDYAMENVD